MSIADPSPVIVIAKGSAFFRVSVQPPEAMPTDWHRPSSYTAHSGASDTARLLALATGWPVLDQTVKPRANDGQEGSSQ